MSEEPVSSKRKRNKTQNTGLKLVDISPKTEVQAETFDAYADDMNLVLHGAAGTGKTFIALYLALREIIDKRSPRRKIVIVRSTVPSRDMGFMPGNSKEKSRVYESPYYEIFTELFGRSDAYEVMKGRGLVEFMTTSFARGMTLNDSVLLVDEFQNMNDMELHTIITRAGENTRLVFSGDFRQDDLTNERFKEKSGIVEFVRVLDLMPSFVKIEFTMRDVVRSGIVLEYLMAQEECGRSTK